MAAFLMGRSRSTGRGHRPMAEINVTPFVDVMLVLLVVFMVTAPLLSVGVSVELPESAAAPIPGQDEPLAVSIDASGRVFIQDSEVSLETLIPRLQAITQNNPAARIFVRGDKSIDYGRVMEVMGTLNGAGFNRVALITERPREK